MMNLVRYFLGIFLPLAVMQICFVQAQDVKVFNHPIDIVYLWVNGNDPEWQVIKESVLASLIVKYKWHIPGTSHSLKRTAAYREMQVLFDSASNNRFVDNEELRYSLRSILKFAPFINHIYIVTMNQKPQWLADHPMITIVDHTEIFKKLDDLPTFNSHALESNLHRVPNLSEHFIYFNDDVFLGAPITPEHFFIGDCLNVLFEKSLSPDGPPVDNETAYRKAWRNSNRFLNKQYKEEPRYRLCHAPFGLRKSYMEQFEAEYPFIFATNSSHKFRSDEDFNVTNGLLQYYWLYNNKVVTHPMSNMMVSLRTDASFELSQRRLNKLKKLKPLSFCLQDIMTEDSVRTKALLHQFLEEYYPEAAPWEK